MKRRILPQWLLTVVGIIGLVGTSWSQPQGTTRYPDGSLRYPDGSVRYPDGSVRYPDGRTNNKQYPSAHRGDRDRDGRYHQNDRHHDRYDRNFPQHRDRDVVIIVDGNGRRFHSPGRPLPPGKAKKVYGHQSARAFTPAQRRKLQARYGYVPPIVISIPRTWARRVDGNRFCYTDRRGIQYWEDRDGFFVIDRRYYF
jgi:hypothetical protein